MLKKVLWTIENSSKYDIQKWHKIDRVRGELKNTQRSNLLKRHALNRELFDEYQVFKQDSAFTYAMNAKELAIKLDSLPLIAEAVIDLAEINISAGMYKEGLDFLETIDPNKVSPHIRSDYDALMGRCYNEMANFSNLSYYSRKYSELGIRYRKEAVELTEKGSFQHLFLKGILKYDEGELKESLSILKKLSLQNLSIHEAALVNSVLGFVYENLGETEKAIEYFSKASISDIKSSTKETMATTALAELLYKKGKTKEASAFIKKAHDDAEFFGAQQRKIAVGTILPLIEEQIVEQIQKQKEQLYNANLVMAFLLVFVIGLTIVTYSQVSKIKKAKKIISKAHKNLQKVNRQIEIQNQQFNDLNIALLEANKMKEEYLGLFFTYDAQIFEKFSEFKSKVENDLEEHNLDKLKYTVKNLDIKREKEKLLKNFDEAFIRLFPDFVEEFNSLLQPKERIKLKRDQILNKELRIFALMRIGINKHEIIAQILGFNINSIYTYKTKIRRKSLLESKDFDQKLLEKTTLKL